MNMMSSRIARFHALSMHPMLGRDFKKLSLAEISECQSLMIELEDLSDDDFLLRINRWKLDQPEKRSPRHGIQWGLMAQSIETKCNRRTK
jgi:hypothetical protein